MENCPGHISFVPFIHISQDTVIVGKKLWEKYIQFSWVFILLKLVCDRPINNFLSFVYNISVNETIIVDVISLIQEPKSQLKKMDSALLTSVAFSPIYTSREFDPTTRAG